MRGLDYGTEEVDKEAIFCIQVRLKSAKEEAARRGG